MTCWLTLVAVPWRITAAVVPPVGAALLLLPSGPVRALSWTAVAALCCAAVATAGWSGPRHPWRWVGVGMALITLSGLLTAPFVMAARPATAVDPSVAVRLPTYLPLLVGVFWLTETAPARPDRWAAVDAAVIVLAGCVLGLLVVVDGRPDGIPALVLPMLDLALIVAALPVLSERARGASQLLLVAGLLSLLLTDAAVVLGVVTGLRTAPYVGALLLLAFLLLALAATHPSSVRLADAAQHRADTRLDPGGPGGPHVTPRRLLLLGIGLVGAPVVLLLSLLEAMPDPGRLVPLAAFGVFVLTAARLTYLVAELVRHDTRREAQVRFSSAFDRSPGGLAMVELTGPDAGLVVEANESLSHLLGRSVHDLLGSPVVDLVHPEDTAGALRLQVALADVSAGRPTGVSVPTRLAAVGRPRFGVVDIAQLATTPNPGSRARARTWAVVQVDDVTERLDTETQLARAALRDPVTGLANRAGLLRTLQETLVDHARGGPPVVVLLLDLDRFKLVNDTHGHAVGDELLREVAGRLGRLRVAEVSRLGGDEFALVARMPAGERLDLLLRRLHGALQPVVELSRGDVVVSASVGVVVHDRPQSGGAVPDAEALIRQADIAMYRAKARGGRRHVVFGEQLQAEVDTRHAIERELRTALTSGGLQVVYQPVVDLEDRSVVAHEALVRLVRRVQGVLVGPAEFLEVAEESGLVRGMGGFVMSTALGTASRDPQGRRMAVNVSGRELAEPDFAGRVLRRLDRAEVAPAALTIEVTESAVVPYLDGVVPQLQTLRAEGVALALDDFGTGYSSLTHLRALPVDIVKIDRSFVERVVLDGPDRRIVAAVTDLATGLGLTTVAEGIETTEQHEAITALGCRYGQGYLYGRPAAGLVTAAPVAQPAEAGALKAQQYGFESRRGHHPSGGAVAAPRTGDQGLR